MGKKWPTNENIHIGDIFKHSSYDECGSGCSFYQVVGLRGKTLVELRGIRGESYVDESCQLGYGQVKVRPLPEGRGGHDCQGLQRRLGRWKALAA